MGNALTDLVKSVLASREGTLPSIQSFAPLDIQQIASSLRLELRGEDDGKRNQPPGDSELDGPVETDIGAEIERRARNGSEEYRSRLDLYEGRIRRAIIATDDRASIEAAGEGALTDFRVRAVDHLDHLFNARSELKGREQEFEQFRETHRLARLPVSPTAHGTTVRALVLAIFVVAESTMNGLFFAEGSEGGLIGGVTQALVISVLNVGAALLCARYALPLLVHRNRGLKVVGAFATLCWVAWALGLNLVVAHFREVFIQGGGHASAPDVVARLSTAPLVVKDAQTWWLAALGVAFSVASLIDSTGLDDPYFGYGGVGRRRAHSAASYADEKARLLADLTELRDSAIGQMTAVIRAMRSAEHDLGLALDGRSRLHANYLEYLKHLSDSYVRLHQRYREANSRARSAQPPTRFAVRPTIPDGLAEQALSELADLGKETRTHVIDRMEHFIRAINQQFEKEVANFQTVDGLTRLEPSPRADT